MWWWVVSRTFYGFCCFQCVTHCMTLLRLYEVQFVTFIWIYAIWMRHLADVGGTEISNLVDCWPRHSAEVRGLLFANVTVLCYCDCTQNL